MQFALVDKGIVVTLVEVHHVFYDMYVRNPKKAAQREGGSNNSKMACTAATTDNEEKAPSL
jgi:hypothetical protein